ncbi:hypothetical protein [Chondrinema litorale]|uniref:hypothetical protein n=1 Tax=Chondrinema litorale TaxID=2994555 RepID=UPI0025432A57|nr:hypothetical protein [Chondrinema litorale]UZR95959.1 hypothetical protein OQ292_09050 [Chondrinema litorale]
MAAVIHKVLESEKEIRTLHHFIKDWNKKHPKKSEQIRVGHIKTSEILIKLALKKIKDFSNPLNYKEVEIENGKSFTCVSFMDNAASVAKQLDLEVKSIKNHFKRLKMAQIADIDYVPTVSSQKNRKSSRYEDLISINLKFFIN